MNKVSKQDYRENFAGFTIRDLAITLAEEPDTSDDAPLEKRLAREGDLIYRFLYIRLEDNFFTYMELRPITNRALITITPEAHWVSVDFNGYVWESKVEQLQKWPGYRLESDTFENTEKKKLDDDDFAINFPQAEGPGSWLSHIRELTVIDGEIYACGGVRKVLKRNAYNDWTDITLQQDHPQLREMFIELAKQGQTSGQDSFVSMDGFCSNDIYACGSKGDCWHYSNKQWQLMNIPTNQDLNKIVCAGDDNVYIAASNGLIIKGQANYEGKPESWTLLQSDIESLFGYSFEGAVWFKNSLYLSTSNGLYKLVNDKLVEVKVDGKRLSSYQKLTTNNDTLILFGPYRAIAFDGETWTEII